MDTGTSIGRRLRGRALHCWGVAKCTKIIEGGSRTQSKGIIVKIKRGTSSSGKKRRRGKGTAKSNFGEAISRGSKGTRSGGIKENY